MVATSHLPRSGKEFLMRISPLTIKGFLPAESRPKPTKPAEPSLIDTRAAAAYIGLQPATLRQWRCQGTGPCYHKYGSGIRARIKYDVQDLDAYLATTRVTPSVRAMATGERDGRLSA